ncbi:MAG TPA: adenylyl-sulfate kinase [Thermoleophilaceae bacterium]|nr:adenylyl-sulfate kinase [Thermoleophilaceae bacterium]
MSAPAFDLQSHSLHSDGALPAAEVVENAARAGVELLALSDHDTVDGVEEALAAGALHGVRVVPAVEVSAVDGGYEDLHVLGYGIDHRSPRLGERLLAARADRERRAEAMAARLATLGFGVDPAPIEARKAAGKPVGRPHLAAAVLAHPANAARLAEEGHTDVSSFIAAYLIQGKPGYVARTHPTVEEAIGWIHDAAGVAVWAHPFWDIEHEDEVIAAIERYRAAGLDGVEVFYASHSERQTLLLADRCADLGLLATGSSDYHGPEHRLFSRFRAHRLHGREPNLGPIAHGTLAAPARDGAGLCFWLTGLSGSGKSTVGRMAAGRLRDLGHRVEVLDGDDVRQNLCAGLGFSREDRATNNRRIAWVADLLSRNGVITFVAAVSPYRAVRDEARARMGERFVEVHVRASVAACEERDVKGLYARARAGEIPSFTGVSDPYEDPLAPEIVLETEAEAPERSAERLVAFVQERLGEPVATVLS